MTENEIKRIIEISNNFKITPVQLLDFALDMAEIRERNGHKMTKTKQQLNEAKLHFMQ